MDIDVRDRTVTHTFYLERPIRLDLFQVKGPKPGEVSSIRVTPDSTSHMGWSVEVLARPWGASNFRWTVVETEVDEEILDALIRQGLITNGADACNENPGPLYLVTFSMSHGDVNELHPTRQAAEAAVVDFVTTNWDEGGPGRKGEAMPDDVEERVEAYFVDNVEDSYGIEELRIQGASA